MENQTHSHSKLQQICDAIRNETLEPARKEAQRLIDEGEKEKNDRIAEGWKEYEKIVDDARKQNEQEQLVVNSALAQASKQAVESLKQSIVDHLFNKELANTLSSVMNNPNVVANIIDGLTKAIEKEGLKTDLSVYVSKNVNADEVNKVLTKTILDKLENNSVKIGDLSGGATVSVKNKNMTISLTDDDVQKLLAEHLRKEFRKLIFND